MAYVKSQTRDFPIEELLDFLFDGKGKGHLAVLYHGMIDDSADRDRQKVIISAAVMGDRTRWEALRIAWRKRLKEDGIEYFKSSHCRHLRGQFQKYRDDVKYPKPLGRKAADRVQSDLDEIQRSCKLLAVGTIIPVPLYEAFRANSKYAALSIVNPYHWAVQTVWMMCAEVAKQLGRGNIVTFAHDNGDDYPVLHELYKKFKRDNPKYCNLISEFIPLDDKTNPPIQAADVAASVTHLHAIEWMDKPGPASLSRLRGTMHRITIWNEKFATLVMDNELKRRSV